MRIVYSGADMDIRGQLLERSGLEFAHEFEAMLVDTLGRELGATSANEFGEFSFDRGPSTAAAVIVRFVDGRRIRCEIPKENEK